MSPVSGRGDVSGSNRLLIQSDLTMLRPISFVTILCLQLPTILAHEGHGLPTHEHGVSHYVVNPSHAVPMLLTVAAATGLWLLIRQLRRSGR